MVISILRMEKMAAIHRFFNQQGLLSGTVFEDIKASVDILIDGSDSEESEGNVAEGDDEAGGDGSDEENQLCDDDQEAVEGDRSSLDNRLSDVVSASRQRKSKPIHRIQAYSQISESGYPRHLEALTAHICQPGFPSALGKFVYFLDHPDGTDIPPGFVYTQYEGLIKVYHSAIATYYAPSDLCGTGGLHRERIRSIPSFHGGRRYDTVFVELDASKEGLLGMVVARIHLFFSFLYRGKYHFCALVHWYIRESDEQDEDTGMWSVHLERIRPGGVKLCWMLSMQNQLFVGLTSFLYMVTLEFPRGLIILMRCVYKSFFVNHFADHHTNELILG